MCSLLGTVLLGILGPLASAVDIDPVAFPSTKVSSLLHNSLTVRRIASPILRVAFLVCRHPVVPLLDQIAVPTVIPSTVLGVPADLKVL